MELKLLAGLSSASARTRAQAVQSLSNEITCSDADAEAWTGLLALVAKIACKDWSPLVRASALKVAATLPNNANHTRLLEPALLDIDVEVRAAAYSALARSDAFEVVCAKLVLESHPVVKRSACSCLETMALSAERVSEAKLLSALGKDEHLDSLDNALAEGEYTGALTSGLEDSDSGVRSAAIRAITTFGYVSCNDLPRGKTQSAVSTIAVKLAFELLIREESAEVRREALRGLSTISAGGRPTLDLACVRALARELKTENAELALAVLASRPMRDLGAFVASVAALETELRSARLEDSNDQGGTKRPSQIDETLDAVVARNYPLACVADLARGRSDKLVPYRACHRG